MNLNYAYDSGDNVRNASLKQRISKVNSTLNTLKRQLYMEKSLLDQQKRELKENGWSLPEKEYMSAPYKTRSSPVTIPAVSTVSVNKEQLKEIESRCEEELEKLDEYIYNVNEFKSNWIKLGETAKENSRKSEHLEKKEYMENIFLEKKYPRGKIFYVDSDLY